MSNPFWKQHPGLVWSNRQAGDVIYIRAALLQSRFHTLLALALEFGLKTLEDEWGALVNEGTRETQRVAPSTERILRNIQDGFRDAQT